MRYRNSLVLLLLGLIMVSATAPNKDWNGLIATFSANLSNPFAFNALPRKVSDATDAGWVLDDSTGSCDDNSSYFRGNRYTLNDDPSAMLLFDVNGYIAGFQTSVPDKGANSFPVTSAHADMYYNETDIWVLTAYFIDPTKICSTGRTQQEFEDEGTGTGLIVQTGQTPSSLMIIPRDEEQLQEDTLYEQGHCVSTMGLHYWYDLTEDINCDDIFPVYTIYLDGTLVAIGWAFNEQQTSSGRWEDSERAVIGYFMKTLPTCIGVDGPFSTMHIYLTNSPSDNICPTPEPSETTTDAALSLHSAPLVSLILCILFSSVYARL